MPSWVAIRNAWQDGKLARIHETLWEAPQATEELFDTLADPWEVNNLAADPTHAERLAAFRELLKRTMASTVDTGLIPESMFRSLSASGTIHDFANSPRFRLQAVLDLAFLATAKNPADLPTFTAAMSAIDPIERYWAVQGCLILGPAAASAVEPLLKVLGDTEPTNRIAAAHALHLIGRPAEACAALLRELERPLNPDATRFALSVLDSTGTLHAIPDDWIKKVRSNKKTDEYVRRVADRLHAERRR